jgi:hypothetical protein
MALQQGRLPALLPGYFVITSHPVSVIVSWTSPLSDDLPEAKIKEQYGEKLTLSGTISIQDTLPRGTVEDVKREVKARIRT